MTFVTYLYRDPKTSVPRYVGKGLETRPREHLSSSVRCHKRLRRMLKKRISEGFNPQPIVIHTSSEADAFEMEELLIAMIGREDLGTGTLFNNTNGGEGECGRIVPKSVRLKTSQTFHSRSAEEKAKTFRLLSDCHKAWWAKLSHEERGAFASKQVKTKCRQCTIDGVTIYQSRKAMIEAIGQSDKGSRSPNFRYI